MPEIVEVVRLRVSADRAEEFVNRRPAVDAEVSKLAGFAGSLVIHLHDDEWMALICWETRADVEAAQKVTEKLEIITDWIALSDEFLSFHTAEIRHNSLTKLVTKGKSS